MELNPDRISKLPDDLLHYILSFIYMDDVVRASILSSRWNNICTTLPYLNFNIPIGRRKDEILHFISKTLDKNYDCIRRICLTAEFCNYNMARYVDTLVPRLTRCNKINELVLDFGLPRTYFELNKCFPEDILDVKSITLLHLTGCLLHRMSNTAIDHVELVSLRKLYLHRVAISGLFLQKILDTSVGLQELSLEDCKRVPSIRITGKLTALVFVRLRFNSYLESVEIDSPSLLHLDIDYCRNLKALVIRSYSLTSLELTNCHKLTKVEFTSPNLQNLKLHCEIMFPISLNAPPGMKAELHYNLKSLGPKEFFDLLNLLIELNGSVSVTLFINIPNIIIPEKWKTRFARMEYLSRCQNLWLGTNIELMGGLQMFFPNHSIIYDSNGDVQYFYEDEIERGPKDIPSFIKW